MENDYISREAVMDALESCDYLCDKRVEDGATLLFHDALARDIADIPAADVRPVVRGAWEQRDVFDARGIVDELQSTLCPFCKRYHTTPFLYSFTHYDYCPNCGAKMDEINRADTIIPASGG